MTQTERAWLAALIDGEGSVIVDVSDRDRGRREFSISLRPSVVICNKDKRILDKVKRITGCGRITGTTRPKYGLFWDWRVRGMWDTPKILAQVHKYLIIKKAKAKVVMRLKEYHSKLLSKPLVYDSGPRKRLANRDTYFLLKFLDKHWFKLVDKGSVSEAKTKKLISRIEQYNSSPP